MVLFYGSYATRSVVIGSDMTRNLLLQVQERPRCLTDRVENRQAVMPSIEELFT